MTAPDAAAETAAGYLQAARGLVARYGDEDERGHAERVLVHGRTLLAGAIDRFEHPERAESYRLRLDLAALLHDVGRSVSAKGHHRHSRYLIRHSDLTSAWPPALRTEVAELARAHRGKPHPRALCRRLGGDRDLLRAAALLRVADGLDRSHVSGVCIVSFGPVGGRFVLCAVGILAPDLRRLKVRKADLFASAFGCAIELRLALATAPERERAPEAAATAARSRRAGT